MWETLLKISQASDPIRVVASQRKLRKPERHIDGWVQEAGLWRRSDDFPKPNKELWCVNRTLKSNTQEMTPKWRARKQTSRDLGGRVPCSPKTLVPAQH